MSILTQVVQESIEILLIFRPNLPPTKIILSASEFRQKSSTRKSSCFPPCCVLESKAEVSFKNGQIVKYGTEGIVRIDVVLFDEWNNIICAWDLKTGSARLTAERINEIIQVVGKGVFEIFEVRG